MATIDGRISEKGLKDTIRQQLFSQLDAIRRQLDGRLEYQSVILSVDQVEKRLFSEIQIKL